MFTSLTSFWFRCVLFLFCFLISSSVIFATPPDAPSILKVIPENSQITLKWSKVRGAVSYNVYRGTIAGNETLIKNNISETKISIPGVNGTQYFFTIKSVNAAGEESEFSTEKDIVLPLPVPVVRIAQLATGRVMLAWPVITGATSYQLYERTVGKPFKLLPSLSFNLNKVTDEIYVTISDLDTTGTYYFKVKAINATGVTSDFSEEVPVLALQSPGTPVIKSAIPVGSQVILQWLTVAGATSYNVYQGTTAGGEAVTPILTGVTGTSVVISNLTTSIPYFFRIKAVNFGGESAFSNEVSATLVNPNEIIVERVELKIDSLELIADGESRTSVRAYVSKGNNEPAVGVTVQFSKGAGILFDQFSGGSKANSAETNSNGVAQLFLQAPRRVGKSTVWVNVNGFTASTTVNFTAGPPSQVILKASPATIHPNETSTLEATVRDAEGNPVAGEVLNFGIKSNNSKGSLNTLTATTDDNGRASVTYTAGAANGTDTLRARLTNGKNSIIKVSVMAPAPKKLALSTNKVAVKSDNSDSAKITATILDGQNAVLPGITVSFSATGGQISNSTGITDSSGKVTVTFSAGEDPTNRLAVVTASIQPTGTLEPREIPIQIIGTTLKLTAPNTSLPSDGSQTVEVDILATNAASQPIFDAPVCFSIDTREGGNLTLLDSVSNKPLAIHCTVAGVTGVLGASKAKQGKTDVTGHLKIKVAGNLTGNPKLIAYAAGASTTQPFIVDLVNLEITAPSKTITPVQTTGNHHTVTVNAPGAKKVTFASSLGTWQNGKETVTVKVVKGTASANLTSTAAGSATVLVSDTNNALSSDTINLIFSAPLKDAAKLLFQAAPRVLPVSSDSVRYTSTLTAILLTNKDQPVANAAISFTMLSGTGGGEIISQPFVVTDTSGKATTTFTSGTQATSANGLTIQAKVPGTSLTKNFKLVVTNQAGSLILGVSNKLGTGANDTTYTLPMSVLVADANGNPVPNAEVFLSVWPLQYSTGIRDRLDYDSFANGEAIVTDTFDNEDVNENLILDAEDFNGDGHLTPPNSAAGTLPQKVTTDSDGLASFALTYPKSSATWIVDRIRVSTQVQGTEMISEFVQRLPALKEDVYGSNEPQDTGSGGTLADSPYNATCPYQVTSSVGTVYVAPGASNSVTLTLTGTKGQSSTKVNGRPVTALIVNKPVNTTGGITTWLNPTVSIGQTDAQGKFESTAFVPSNSFQGGIATNIYYFVGCAVKKLSLIASTQVISKEPTTLTITTQSTRVAPNGDSILSAQVLDTSNNPLIDQWVNFSLLPNTSGASFSVASAQTDSHGVATVTYTAGSLAGTDTIVATTAGKTAVSGQLDISVDPTLTVVNSLSISAGIANNSVPVGAGVPVDIRATVIDIKGKPASGVPVVFTTTAGTFQGAAAPGNTVTVTTNPQGRADVFLLSGDVVGTATVMVNANGFVESTTVDFMAGPPSSVVLNASPNLVTTSGGTASVVATIVDAYGNGIGAGQKVKFSVSRSPSGGVGSITLQGTTDNNSQVTATYTAGATAGIDTVTATLPNGVFGTAQITVSASAATVGTVTLSSGSATLTADGVSRTTITATVKDPNGVPLQGKMVTFATISGSLSAVSAVTNADGQARVKLMASTSLGPTTITANADNVLGSVQVEFVAGTPSSLVVTLAPTIVNPDGSTTVTATVKDASNNLVSGTTVKFALATNNSGGSFTGATSVTTNLNGQASIQYTAGPAEIETTDAFRVNVASNPRVVGQAYLTVAPGAIVVGTVALSVGGTTLPADGTSSVILRATVMDNDQNPAPGITVIFSSTAGTVQPATAITNSKGVASATLTAPSNLSKTLNASITAMASGVISAAQNVTFTTTTITLVGTAAIGAPFDGAMVTIKDSTTPIPQTVKGVTSATGDYRIDVTGMQPPFMLAASKGSQYMFSILPEIGANVYLQNVNITPLTTLVTYELSMKNGMTPVTMYQDGSFSGITAEEVATSQIAVRKSNSLAFAFVSMDKTFDMMYDPFTANGTPDSTGYVTTLDTLGAVTNIATSGVTLLSKTTTTTYTVSSGTTGISSIALVLRDVKDTTDIMSIDNSTPALVKATVNDATGNPVAGAIVTFVTDGNYGSFSAGGAALTDSNGLAKVKLSTSNTTGGAATITVQTMVSGTTVSSSINYAVGASSLSLVMTNDGSSNPCEVPISGIAFGVELLSAYGTTSAAVAVCNGSSLYTIPIPVNFESSCTTNGKASLTSTVNTIDGIASASYRDNGCNNPTTGDAITASLSNGNSVSGNLPVESPSLGSIQFVSVVTNPVTTPPVITLKGTGGTARSETANVTFRVVDSNGNPIGNQQVDFSLNTSIGGLKLGSLSAISDPSTGDVVTTVISGTISTAVRVTASSEGLTTQSDELIISTGIPAQDSISLRVAEHNIEGWDYDGVATTLTARLADHFHNPVPDGTAVYFTTEGGSITPSCTTIGGVCDVTLTSQSPRPNNGRITVLATAVGEEAFIDLNGNGTVDDSSEMIDATFDPENDEAPTTDMPEAYVDYNENGVRDENEVFFDFNNNNGYDEADELYNGILCTSDAEICSVEQKSIHVRASEQTIFSTSQANIIINDDSEIALNSCEQDVGVGPSLQFVVNVVDQNGNAMPAGTTVSFSSDNGKISSKNYTIQDTAGCRISDIAPNCTEEIGGSDTFGNIDVVMKSDSTATSKIDAEGNETISCTNANGDSGYFTVTVTTPKGIVTTKTAVVTD